MKKCEVCGEALQNEPAWYLPHNDLVGHAQCLLDKFVNWCASNGIDPTDEEAGAPYLITTPMP